MPSELARIIDEIRRDKSIDKDVLIKTIELALIAAAKKKYGPHQDIEAHFNEELGEIELFQFKTVVNKVKNHSTEISLEEARKLDPEVEMSDSLGIKMNIMEFGRIAAQAAKQVLIQKIRDAEGENIYQDFKDRKGDLISGTVNRFDRGNIIVNIGRTDGILLPQEQVPTEGYEKGDRIKAYILDIRRPPASPQVILSRTHPGMVTKLFELEIPEIKEKIVEIKGVAREPGVRTKVAVYSHRPDVGPIGTCVGAKGIRIQNVTRELNGEKIDIIPWSEEPAKFVCNALAPAEISEVIVDKTQASMEVIVEDDQLSLAIGKRGQNVRLASKLTGWRINIRAKSKKEGLLTDAFLKLKEIPGIGDSTAEILFKEGYFTLEDIAYAKKEDLTKIEGIGEKRAIKLLKSAQEYLISKISKERDQEEK